MMRNAAIAVAVLLAVLLIVRERLHDRSPAVLRDVPDEVDRSARDRFNLPPSGFEPGHRLFDTLKNEKLQSPPQIPLGIYAYRRYLVLPRREREAIRAGIEASVWTANRIRTATANSWRVDSFRRSRSTCCISRRGRARCPGSR